MGFRTGAYATVWKVEPRTEKFTKARISVSKKNQDGTYEDEFASYVSFVGSEVARKAAQLHERDRIKLGDVDVTRTYKADEGKEYINYKIFSFEPVESRFSSQPSTDTPHVEEGDTGELDLPF